MPRVWCTNLPASFNKVSSDILAKNTLKKSLIPKPFRDGHLLRSFPLGTEPSRSIQPPTASSIKAYSA